MSQRLVRITVVLSCLIVTGNAHAEHPELRKLNERFKPGLYRNVMTHDGTGVIGGPKTPKLPPTTFNQCLTQEDLERGRQFNTRQQGGMNCELSNVKVSGNTASYTQTCNVNGSAMRTDITMVMAGNVMTMKMLGASVAGDQVVKIGSTLEMTYLGPCTK